MTLLPQLMGIVNVTPDSFSDGGKFLDPGKAIAHGLKLIEEGADILDIGGESTRPGSKEISAEDEQARILPVIKGLEGKGARISVDTRHASTMRAAIDHGAVIINDITALTGDTDSMKVIAETGVSVCLMHMRGKPQTMQEDPVYDDVTAEVLAFLLDRAFFCQQAGIRKENIILDPGIGFGKTLEHNLQLMRELDMLTGHDHQVLLGASRKSFIAKLMDDDISPEDRLPGSLAAVLRGLEAGVRMFRVHDVAATKQAVAAWLAMTPS